MSSQYGFFVDTTRCIKCWACVVACKQWNGIKAGGVSRRKVEETVEGTFPNCTRTFVSKACNHCEDAACVASCPTGALTKREEDGMVVFDREVCIGCQPCSTVCPFGVPEYDVDDLKLNKCDGCVTCGRTEEGETHCVATCPTKALHFGPLDEMEALAAEKGGTRMEGDTKPSVFIA